jgi:hypothetical protein
MNAYDLADDVKNISNAIEALEWVQKASLLLIQQAKEIERLIGAEPITYGMLTFCKNCGEQNPYYTAPRELSDEEITEVLNDENIAEYHQGNWLVLPYAFARAILKKASEK